MQGGSFITAAQFAQAVGRIVERYDGDGTSDMEGLVYPIKVWELINEYSSSGMSKQYPSEFTRAVYMDMMQQGAAALKSACPDCLLAFDPFYEDDVTALLGQFSASNIDLIAFHAYTPLDFVDDYASDFYIGNIAVYLSRLGLSGKPVWVTEYAFYDHKGANRAEGTFPGSQEDNARWFVQTTGWGFGSGAFEKIIYTEIEPPKDAQTDPALAWMSLVDSSGGKKPIYYAFQKMVSMIDRYESKEALSLGTDIYGYKFKKDSKVVCLVWSRENTGSHQVALPLPQSSRATVTEAVPDGSGDFSSTVMTFSGGSLALTVAETPVYVEADEAQGGAPAIAASPASVDFGEVQQGHTSTPARIVVSNTGGAGLTIGSVALTGDSSSCFAITGDNCTNSTFGANRSCAVQAVFSPSSRGPHSARISISSNDPETPVLDIALAGTGVATDGDNGTDQDNATKCPIASVLGEHDAGTQALRAYRDDVLAKTASGRLIIQTYYAGADVLLRLCELSPHFKETAKTAVRLLAEVIATSTGYTYTQ